MLKSLPTKLLIGLFMLASVFCRSAESEPRIAAISNAPAKKDQPLEMVSSVIGYLTAQVEVQREILGRTPPTFAGGDGSTLEKAIVIHAPDAKAGMKAENEWLEDKYPGHHLLCILPLKRGVRIHHQVEVVAVDGTTNRVFFEATGFYGKAPRSQPFLPTPKEFFVGEHRLAFSGGDGSQIEKAVIITGAPDQMAGIRSEYFWLATRMPDHRLIKQALLWSGDKYYDRLDVVGPGGTDYSFYFDISRFFRPAE